MDNRTVTVGDIEVAVLEAGQGGDPLLLVHGFVGAKEDFADHLDWLAAEGWHCVAPDLRGHGSSSKPNAESAYSFEILAGDLVGLADALAWERFVVLGHSMGGMVVQHVALDHHHRLDALILMDTCHGPVDVDPESIELGKAVVSEGGMAALLEAQRAAGPGPLETPAGLRLQETRPGYKEFGEAKSLAVADAMWLKMVDEMTTQADRLEALAALQVPTLVIAGEQDAPFVGPCQRIAAAMAGTRIEVIPDAGHSPQFENPSHWRDVMARFLAEVRAEAVAS